MAPTLGLDNTKESSCLRGLTAIVIPTAPLLGVTRFCRSNTVVLLTALSLTARVPSLIALGP